MDLVFPTFESGAMDRYRRLRSRFISRDSHAELIHQVRKGNIRQLFPEELDFSLTFQGVPIANFIDNAAQDLARTIAPLPSLDCVSGKMVTDADTSRAERKNRIGDNYWRFSRLKTQMTRGADRYITYGFLPFYVEPHVEGKMPFICVGDPRYSYYELDRYGNCKVFASRKLKTVDQLCTEWPEYARIIKRDPDTGVECGGDILLEVVTWIDSKRVALFLPERGGLSLGSYEHRLSRTPVWIAERPGEDDTPRGQFDDVVWVQVARAIMSLLALQAAHTAVTAPIAAPDDMDEFPVGPMAILQSENADRIRRVNLELPVSTFAEVANLNDELKAGSQYPDARTGGVQASVITGKGIEALLGTFDTQIKGAQLVFQEALEQVTSMCFEMDEVWWPNESKRVSGTMSGSSYEFSYTPGRDINGRWDCVVTYGFALGQTTSAAMITLLQLEGSGVIDKGTFMSNLPFGIDPIQEQRRIHITRAREALEQGMFSLIQSSGPLAAQGQDPMPIIKLAVDAIKGLRDGQTVEQAVESAYTAMEEAKKQAMEEQLAQMQQAQGAPAEGGLGGVEGIGPDGLPDRVAPGQAGLPPGGLPDLLNTVVGFRGEADLPVNSATVTKRTPI